MVRPGIAVGAARNMTPSASKTIAGALALAAYERALEPKRLELVPGGHFDPYVSQFDQSSRAALDWFKDRRWTQDRRGRQEPLESKDRRRYWRRSLERIRPDSD